MFPATEKNTQTAEVVGFLSTVSSLNDLCTHPWSFSVLALPWAPSATPASGPAKAASPTESLSSNSVFLEWVLHNAPYTRCLSIPQICRPSLPNDKCLRTWVLSVDCLILTAKLQIPLH